MDRISGLRSRAAAPLAAVAVTTALVLSPVGPALARTAHAVQDYTYSGQWPPTSATVSLTLVPNVTVENLPDSSLQSSQLVDFQTNDPRYSCLNGEALDVWTAPAEFPGKLVVHNGDQGPQCTYGTWTFSIQPPPPKGYSGISSGASIATVTVNSIGTTSTRDWFGPYYQMNYSVDDANTTAGYSVIGSFGAGQGCSNGCWTQTFVFPSDETLQVRLTLMDNQTNFGGGMDYVNINGDAATDTIVIAGVTDTSSDCEIDLEGSTCSWPTIGEAGTTVQTSGSSGSRTASVSVDVRVQELFNFQAGQIAQVLSAWSALDGELNTYFGNGENSCEQQLLNSLQQQDSQLRDEMVFMIADTMFGFVPIPGLDEITQFLIDEAASAIWHAAGYAATGDFAAASAGFASLSSSFPGGLSFNCTSDEVVWSNYAAPLPLQAQLGSAEGSAQQLDAAIESGSLAQLKSDLSSEASWLGSIASLDGQLIDQGANMYQSAFGVENGDGDDLSEFALPLLASVCQFESYVTGMEQVEGMSASSQSQACGILDQTAYRVQRLDTLDASLAHALTRAQFAAVVTQLFGLALPSHPIGFRDVGPRSDDYLAIEAAAPYMATVGGNFWPGRLETRLSAAYTIGRLLVAEHRASVPSLRDATGLWSRFGDTKALPGHYPMVARYAAITVEEGLLVGYGEHLFRPGVPVDGSEAAAMAARLARR